MDPVNILILGCIFTALIALTRPFLLLPLLIFGVFVEPMQYFPELVPYRPSMLVGTVAVSAIFVRFVLIKEKMPKQSKQVKVTAVFVLWLALTCWLNRDTSWEAFISYSRSFAVYFICVYVVKTKKQLLGVTWTLLLFGLLVCVYGVYCLKANIGWSAGGYKRIASFMNSPDTFGETSALLVPIAIAVLISVQSNLVKAIVVGIIAFLTAGVVISFSRAALFALMLGILLTPLKVIAPERRPFVIIALCILLLGAFYFFPSGPKYRMWSRTASIFRAKSAEDIDLGRVMTMRAGLRMVKEHPIIGVGLGGFKPEYKRLAEVDPNIVVVRGSRKTGTEVLSVHNVVIEAASMTGLVGLALYMWIIWLAFKDARAAMKLFSETKSKIFENISASIQVFMICGLLIGMFTPFLSFRLFWMLIPFSAVLYRLSFEELSQRPE